MKEEFLSFEDINKDFPITPEVKCKIDLSYLVNTSKQIADTFFILPDFSEKRLEKNLEKNRKDLWLDSDNYQRFLIWISLSDNWQYSQALEVFDEIMIYYPDNDFVLTEIGELFYNMQNYENAIKIYNKILEHNHKHFNALHRLWTIYYSFAWHDKAIQYYKTIQDYYPDFKDINIYIWYTYNQLWDYTNAISSLQIAKDICQENIKTQASILEWIWDWYFWLEQYSEAETYFLASSQKYSSNDQIFLKIAQSNMRLNNYAKAIEYIHLHIDIYWADFTAIYNLWVCYYMSWEYKQAEKYFDLTLRLDPEDIDIMIYKINCIYTLNWKQDALAYLQTLLDKDPHNQDLYNILEDINNS